MVGYDAAKDNCLTEFDGFLLTNEMSLRVLFDSNWPAFHTPQPIERGMMHDEIVQYKSAYVG